MRGNLSRSVTEESTSDDGEEDVEGGEGDEDAEISPSGVKGDAERGVELVSDGVRAERGR